MSDLSMKEAKFVKEYVETGNGTKSALKAYDTDSEKVAGVIASQNLGKLRIQNAIEEALGDDLLAKKHLELLNSTKVEHMVFPLEVPELTDEHIKELLAEVNCKVRKIVHGDTARHVYFWSSNDKAKQGALDMAYKIKGNYKEYRVIPETNNLQVNIQNNINLEELAEEASRLLKEKKLNK